MDGPTRSNRAPNPAAYVSLLAGIAAVAVWPVAIGAARYSRRVDLVYAGAGAAAVGAILAVVAIVLARYARRRIQRTLGRSRRRGTARLGRFLGVLGLCMALTGALALGFFGLLQLFAR